MQENRSFDHYYGTYPRRARLRRPPARLARELRPGLAGRARPHAAPLPPRQRLGHGRVHPGPRPQLAGRAHELGRRRPTAPSSARTCSRSSRAPSTASSPWATTAGRTCPSTTRWPTPSPSATTTTARCSGRRTRTGSWRSRAPSTRRARPAGRCSSPTGRPDAVGSVHWDTMPEVLEDAGVSWKVYNPVGHPLHAAEHPEERASCSDAILPYFSQYQDPSSRAVPEGLPAAVPERLRQPTSRRGTLPAVSWIIPPAGYDEHPSSPPALGEWFTSQVLAALVSNPEVWSKTVLFHMYDENDGFFDHVPPPVAPKGTRRRVRHRLSAAERRHGHGAGRSAWASGSPCW